MTVTSKRRLLALVFAIAVLCATTPAQALPFVPPAVDSTPVMDEVRDFADDLWEKARTLFAKVRVVISDDG